MLSPNITQSWFSNVRADVLASIVVALALIPESIAFATIAGVDPQVALYASFCISIVVSLFGGRPAMISAATGAMALLMVNLVKDHGLQYLLATTLLTGVLQILCGVFKIGQLMRFVSKSVMTGFVNALAILYFLAQLPELIGASWVIHALVAGGLAIIYLLPRVTKAIPSPIVAIIVLTILSIQLDLDVKRVGDLGTLPASLPTFFIPQVPFNFETLGIIAPYALALCFVGLLESLMTAQIIDEFTDTKSSKNRECVGQGLANFVTGLFGGMAGCAMIGQSVINVKTGGRTRLSTLLPGVILLILIVAAGPWVKQIPIAALVAVMLMVSVSTFSWSTFRNLKLHPASTSAVMITTVIVIVWTHNLALGVGVGVLLSALFFARKISQVFRMNHEFDETTRTRTYHISGQVFFASSDAFYEGFDFDEVPRKVVIDVTHAHFWDITSVATLDKVVYKYRRLGAEIDILGLNEASATIVDRLATHDKAHVIDKMLEH
jgi:sulfate permease, SulP family